MSCPTYEFGAVIKAPIEALDWLEQTLEGQIDSDYSDWHDENIMTCREDAEFCISTFCGCDAQKFALFEKAICEMQMKFLLQEPIDLTWSEFWIGDDQWFISGGAMVCYKGKATRMISPTDWVNTTIAELLEEDCESNTNHPESDQPDEEGE